MIWKPSTRCGVPGWNAIRKTRGSIMVCTDQNKRIGNETRDEEQIFCSSCAAEPHLFIPLLNSRNGKQYRVFRCECGKIIWDEYGHLSWPPRKSENTPSVASVGATSGASARQHLAATGLLIAGAGRFAFSGSPVTLGLPLLTPAIVRQFPEQLSGCVCSQYR